MYGSMSTIVNKTILYLGFLLNKWILAAFVTKKQVYKIIHLLIHLAVEMCLLCGCCKAQIYISKSC